MLGMSNILVGHVNEPEDPAAKADGCWDGDTLTNLGFINIWIRSAACDVDHGNQGQEVLFAEGEWKMQGVRGINSLNNKRKVKTTPKSSEANHVPVV
jgi:hypothetical protein